MNKEKIRYSITEMKDYLILLKGSGMNLKAIKKFYNKQRYLLYIYIF